MKYCLPIIMLLCVACSTSPKQATKAGVSDIGFIPAATHENGWLKRGEGPVLGGPELGTCFDVNVIPDGPAISPDGIRQWERLEANPLIEPTEGYFDALACYKPSVFRDEENDRWQLWYNGRNEGAEYIGYAVHEGLQLD